MEHPFLVFSVIVLFTSCLSKPVKRSAEDAPGTMHPTVHFSLDGNLFQMRLLSPTQSGAYKPFATAYEKQTSGAEEEEADGDASTATQYAVVRVVPKTTAPLEDEISGKQLSRKDDKTLKTFYKMKDLYKEFGKMLKQHEELLLTLTKKNDDSPTEPSAVDDSAKGNRFEVNVNKQDSQDVPVSDKDAYEGSLNAGQRKDDSNNLNIHVHADPPLKLRTIIGYPQKTRMGKVVPLRQQQANIRIFQRDTPTSTLTWDVPDESIRSGTAGQELSSEQTDFINRGLALLHDMWERFQSQKAPSNPGEQEQQNFSEEVVNADDLEPYNPYR